MAGRGVIGINGAAAHRVNISDVIVIAYGQFAADEASTLAPRIVDVCGSWPGTGIICSGSPRNISPPLARSELAYEPESTHLSARRF